jgi:hypothetical protein
MPSFVVDRFGTCSVEDNVDGDEEDDDGGSIQGNKSMRGMSPLMSPAVTTSHRDPARWRQTRNRGSIVDDLILLAPIRTIEFDESREEQVHNAL